MRCLWEKLLRIPDATMFLRAHNSKIHDKIVSQLPHRNYTIGGKLLFNLYFFLRKKITYGLNISFGKSRGSAQWLNYEWQLTFISCDVALCLLLSRKGMESCFQISFLNSDIFSASALLWKPHNSSISVFCLGIISWLEFYLWNQL